jgi:hypothetical protein
MMAFDVTLTLISNTARMIFFIVGVLAFIKYLIKK